MSWLLVNLNSKSMSISTHKPISITSSSTGQVICHGHDQNYGPCQSLGRWQGKDTGEGFDQA